MVTIPASRPPADDEGDSIPLLGWNVEVALPKTKAPAQTFEEAYYLKKLVESQKPVRVRLVTGELVEGRVEYWDAAFLRLTCDDGPNLFIYKDKLRYIEELEQD